MGNSHPGSGASISSSQPSPPLTQPSTPQQQYPAELLREAMPVPCHRSESFEREMSSSLSGMSGLCAHKEGMVGSFEGDFISPGQYRARYRSNSVSVDSHLSNHHPPVLKPFVPAVIKWDKGGVNVSISGSFNKWEKKIPLVKSTNNFYTIIELGEGEHRYKYYVDGQWMVNPDEPTITDSQGVKNNVVTVTESDFEIFDALDKDSHAVSQKENNTSAHTGDACMQSDYGQHIPSRKDKLMGPPVLPQHLLQVILNKDVPHHLEPGLLPEPNHVMLNHMYALSIKDGVMVLSDTSRFRKKCITTLLYKPID